jgi:hypothetical protein
VFILTAWLLFTRFSRARSTRCLLDVVARPICQDGARINLKEMIGRGANEGWPTSQPSADIRANRSALGDLKWE